MRILDWRPCGERWLTRLWGQPRPTGGGLWAGCHDLLMARRVAGRAPAVDGPLVVSVGNLALGGTGKTPIVLDLARNLAGRGRRGAVITRGFRSPLPGPLVVSADLATAGDEARLLAGGLAGTGWTVVQARSRPAGLRYATAVPPPPEVLILEDAHQTARIGRHLDVLILDNWEVREGAAGPQVAPLTGGVLPFGPWRESARGARRASVWLVETGGPVPPRGTGGERVLAFERRLVCRPVGGRSGPPRQPALLSGIARPERFERGASALLPEPPPLAIRLRDHEPFGDAVVSRVQAALAEAGCGSLVTTAKDWVKLQGRWPREIPAFVMDLEIGWGQAETLADVIDERLAVPDREDRDGA